MTKNPNLGLFGVEGGTDKEEDIPGKLWILRGRQRIQIQDGLRFPFFCLCVVGGEGLALYIQLKNSEEESKSREKNAVGEEGGSREAGYVVKL